MCWTQSPSSAAPSATTGATLLALRRWLFSLPSIRDQPRRSTMDLHGLLWILPAKALFRHLSLPSYLHLTSLSRRLARFRTPYHFLILLESCLDGDSVLQVLQHYLRPILPWRSSDSGRIGSTEFISTLLGMAIRKLNRSRDSLGVPIVIDVKSDWLLLVVQHFVADYEQPSPLGEFYLRLIDALLSDPLPAHFRTRTLEMYSWTKHSDDLDGMLASKVSQHSVFAAEASGRDYALHHLFLLFGNRICSDYELDRQLARLPELPELVRLLAMGADPRLCIDTEYNLEDAEMILRGYIMMGPERLDCVRHLLDVFWNRGLIKPSSLGPPYQATSSLAVACRRGYLDHVKLILAYIGRLYIPSHILISRHGRYAFDLIESTPHHRSISTHIPATAIGKTHTSNSNADIGSSTNKQQPPSRARRKGKELSGPIIDQRSLWEAVSNGHWQVADELLSCRFLGHTRCYDYLGTAVRNNDPQMVRLLLEKGDDWILNWQLERALKVSQHNRQTEIARMLCTKLIIVNCRDS
ncbi:uncharacterized protein BJ171DRAFT_515156 [Polychytrium aggregatum]|uniref:uncharacterized protein n=1 Tax=Polychytrium aggregatum TaxID=110093 RepID=UPI0022FF3688|nr:uncharacterized protein BJ171DRAFT_515156 [Polychytrium aggregatum]KAI9202190.1 hypothetical protein BJ171DRAFT_515156 [Polychytrium aggregatum]